MGKLREVSAILNDNTEHLPLPIINKVVDLPELQGDAKSVAIEKAKVAVASIQGPCIIEDTCLFFNAWNGLPGPYIKWFMSSCGNEGLNKMLTSYDDKSASATAIFSFCAGVGQPVHLFEGEVKGKIVPSRGSEGFGWDPIFEPEESNGKTFAEMTKDEKNLISHRRRALQKLRTFLLENKDLWTEQPNK
uniref:Inosine triphosphate pyrophosphatase n=1 Tax=Arcella intermedia TaxID=1963864 RepID=A0A6B2LJB3_9EUKA